MKAKLRTAKVRRRKTVSNISGDFIFENLPSGDYILTFEANGLVSVMEKK